MGRGHAVVHRQHPHAGVIGHQHRLAEAGAAAIDHIGAAMEVQQHAMGAGGVQAGGQDLPHGDPADFHLGDLRRIAGQDGRQALLAKGLAGGDHGGPLLRGAGDIGWIGARRLGGIGDRALELRAHRGWDGQGAGGQVTGGVRARDVVHGWLRGAGSVDRSAPMIARRRMKANWRARI